MMVRRVPGFAGLLAVAMLWMGCAAPVPVWFFLPEDYELAEVTASDRQWTGVAVSRENRMFVNYPRWSDNVPVSVAERLPLGTEQAFPNDEWNRWDPSLSPEDRFVCVQSVWADGQNNLWILDAANPQFQGVVPGGAKLVKVDLSTNQVARIYPFDETVAPTDSYLNDVRVDNVREYAYITDSGTGGIIVLNLRDGQAWRRLDNHPSAHSEGIDVTINGEVWRRPDGSKPVVHSDGIALSTDGLWVYYQALTATSLYRIQSYYLRDLTLSDEEVGEKVEFLGRTGPADGLAYDADGNIYLSHIEDNAVRIFTPERRVKTLVSDDRLDWPDSFAIGPDGTVYVTTSQINLGPNPPEPYKIFRLVERH